MSKGVKILLGGVPFGRNNVGDEAILECVVKIVREICPAADITVSTDDPAATAKKLNVKTVQLFGFDPPYSRALMEQTLRENDVFIWSGATGLSDYPEIPLDMLSIAHLAGTRRAGTLVCNDGFHRGGETPLEGCHTLAAGRHQFHYKQ